MIKPLLSVIFILFFVTFCAQIYAQTTADNDSVFANKEQGRFKKALKNFFDFGSHDTLYVAPNRYNYALMGTHFSHFERYSIDSNEEPYQRIGFSPNPHYKLGVYFGWRWIFLGWSVDVDDLTRKSTKGNRGTTFDLSLYSSKIGLDLFYRSTGNNYTINDVAGFENIDRSDYSASFNGLKVNIRGLYVYYIFNNRRFSYPAAYSQSTNQRRNAGSLMAGISCSKHKLEWDNSRFPEEIRLQMNPAIRVRKVEYINAALYAGYAYNWVFARHCLANLSLNPAIAYKTSSIEMEDQANPQNGKWSDKFSLEFLTRAAVVYHNGKYFVGTSFVGKLFNYRHSQFALMNAFGTLQIYAGFNFNLKKEYRKRKTTTPVY